MKQVDDVSDAVVLNLTALGSPLHQEDQETEDKLKSYEILNSIHRHSFSSVNTVSTMLPFFGPEDHHTSKGSIAAKRNYGSVDFTSSGIPNGALNRSFSEANITALSKDNIYFIPMPKNFSRSGVSNDSCYAGEAGSYGSRTTASEPLSLDSGVYDVTSPSAEFPAEEVKHKFDMIKREKSSTVALQVLVPYLIAGVGTCGAGLLLDILQYWPVFQGVPELFVVVTPLLGLKGNLEMTLASRLSTQANLGNLRTFKQAFAHGWGNMVLKLAQASIMGLIAAAFAIISNVHDVSYQTSLLLCCSCLATATITTVGLGTVTTTVVVVSHRFNINPDNIATPIAASLGDVATLGVLALIARKLYETKEAVEAPLAAIIIFLIMVPFWIYWARKNIHMQRLILTGWVPIIIAVVITSGGGFILEKALRNFGGMAVFQPVINGIGGNLVAVQASRIATYFHQRSKLGTLPSSSNQLCATPCSAFIGKNDHARTAIILMLLVVPGHLIFAYSIHWIKGGDTSLSLTFTPIYLSAALLQVAILLYVAHCMIHWMWRFKIDPDNSAIPFLTALGDLFGTGLLALAFVVFELLVPPNRGDSSASSPSTNVTNTLFTFTTESL